MGDVISSATYKIMFTMGVTRPRLERPRDESIIAAINVTLARLERHRYLATSTWQARAETTKSCRQSAGIRRLACSSLSSMFMRTDARIKQAFPLILTLLITLGAYAQALGLGHLFGAHLSAGMPVVKGPSQEKGPERKASPERMREGGAILARNPFDSVTGPLDASEPRENPGKIAQANGENPYADPICESLRVLLITTADDPTWSFAAIAMGREKASLRRVGDAVGQHMVLAMAWDRVWMHDGGARCQSKLHGEFVKSELKQPPIGKGQVPGGLAEKIRHIADHRSEVDPSIIEEVMANQRRPLGSARVPPAR